MKVESPKLSGALAERDVCCHACGYNLRGARSVLCPECGAVIPAIVSAHAAGAPRKKGRAFGWLTANTCAGLLIALHVVLRLFLTKGGPPIGPLRAMTMMLAIAACVPLVLQLYVIWRRGLVRLSVGKTSRTEIALAVVGTLIVLGAVWTVL